MKKGMDFPYQLKGNLFVERLKNDPFNKHVIFYGFLKGKGADEIEIVQKLLDSDFIYKIFSYDTKDETFNFLDNIIPYFYDKEATLNYLSNYKDEHGSTPFTKIIKGKYSEYMYILEDMVHEKLRLKKKIHDLTYTEYLQSRNPDFEEIERRIDKQEAKLKELEDVKKTKDIIMKLESKTLPPFYVYESIIFYTPQNTIVYDVGLNTIEYDENDIFLVTLIEKGKVKRFPFKKIEGGETNPIHLKNSILFELTVFLNFGNGLNIDIKLALLYQFTNKFFSSFEVKTNIILFLNNHKERFKEKQYYILFEVVFYSIYKIQKGFLGLLVTEKYTIDVEFLEWASDFHKETNRKKFKVPLAFNSLQYSTNYLPLQYRYTIIEFKEKNDEYIDPSKVLAIKGFRIVKGYKVTEEGGKVTKGKFSQLKKQIKAIPKIPEKNMIQEIIKYCLFLRTKTTFYLSSTLYPSIGIYIKPNTPFINLNIEVIKGFLENINPRLEKMFIYGGLDPTPFIPGIRIFNELYTIKYIFPSIIKKTQTKSHVKDVDLVDEFKMLIFTSEKERVEHIKIFMNSFRSMKQERLNTYKKNIIIT